MKDLTIGQERSRAVMTTFRAVALALAAGACAVPADVDDSGSDSVEAVEQSLYRNGGAGAAYWPLTGGGPEHNVSLCWATSGWAQQKQWVENAVRRTWGRAAYLTFSFAATCPLLPAGAYVKMYISEGDGGSTYTGGYATRLNDPGVTFGFRADGSLSRGRVEYLGVHELGHVLGFSHEHWRPEGAYCDGSTVPGGTPIGPYDIDSVMNYCNSYGNAQGVLSEGDIAGVRQAYGFRPGPRAAPLGFFDSDSKADQFAVDAAGIYVNRGGTSSFTSAGLKSNPFWGTRGTFFADVTGDGKSDAIAINDGNIWVDVNGATAFASSGSLWLNAPFYGYRVTLTGDFTGDGRADIAAINDGEIHVLKSNGSAFFGSAMWYTTPFWGSLVSLAGDVSGDGKDDIVAVSGDKVYVVTSTGSGFTGGGAWTSSLFRGRETLLGDVNGDGKMDLIAVWRDNIQVRLSTGTSFGPVQFWSTSPFFGEVETRAGDVNGDGYTDLVATNDDATYVLLSTGTAFASSFTYWSGAFYGGL